MERLLQKIIDFYKNFKNTLTREDLIYKNFIMKNAEKYRQEYFYIKNRLKKIQKEYENIFNKYQVTESTDWKNPLYEEYVNLLQCIRESKYTDELREGKIKITDIIGLDYEEDIEKIHSLFLEKKRLKGRLGRIKGIILRNFLYY